ncbi:unnamed protein product, partial [Musa acuminata subsp. malaccensis]
MYLEYVVRPSWSKVNSGLPKMNKFEVLKMVPIMQHFLFVFG